MLELVIEAEDPQPARPSVFRALWAVTGELYVIGRVADRPVLAGTLAHRAHGVGRCVAVALDAGLDGCEASAAVWSLAAELRALRQVVDDARAAPAAAPARAA